MNKLNLVDYSLSSCEIDKIYSIMDKTLNVNSIHTLYNILLQNKEVNLAIASSIINKIIEEVN